MKTKLHAFVCTALLGVGAIMPAHADQSLEGNLTVTGGSTGNLFVTGAVDIDGNSLTFGTQDASYGAGLIYTDSPADTLNFLLNRTTSSWLWQHTTVAAMRLDSGHKLSLYQADGTTVGVSLDPVTSTLSLGSAALYRDSNGALKTDGAFTVGGIFIAPSYTATSGTITGGASGLTLNAGGTDQNITFSPGGTGVVVINSPVLINDTTASTSPTSGALQVAGGGGIGGNLNVGGDLKIAGSFSGGASGLVLNSNVGIGTSGPAAKLAVRAVAGEAAINLLTETINANLDLVPISYKIGFGPGVMNLPNAALVFSAESLDANLDPLGAYIFKNGNVLVGTTSDSGNGRLQLAPHTVAAGGIGFGPDTNLYRSGAGTLKTDGRLVVVGNARFEGSVRVAPQGDLSMGEFTSGPQ